MSLLSLPSTIKIIYSTEVSSKYFIYQVLFQEPVVVNVLIEDLFTSSNTTQSTPIINVTPSHKQWIFTIPTLISSYSAGLMYDIKFCE
jgi:hypothetical protein